MERMAAMAMTISNAQFLVEVLISRHFRRIHLCRVAIQFQKTKFFRTV